MKIRAGDYARDVETGLLMPRRQPGNLRSHYVNQWHAHQGLMMGAPVNPFDAFVELSLHMNGADNSVSFIDSSHNHHVATVYGDSKISTARSIVGGASSGLFDGTGDYITFPVSPSWNFGAGAFCIRGWIYPTSISGNINLCSQSDYTSNTDTSFSVLFSNGYARIIFTTGGAYTGLGTTKDGTANTGPLVANQWNFFVFQRVPSGTPSVPLGQELALGVGQVGGNIIFNTPGSGGISHAGWDPNNPPATATIHTSSQPLTVSYSTSGIPGNLKEFQIIKGWAPYLPYGTSSNAPPTTPVPTLPFTP